MRTRPRGQRARRELLAGLVSALVLVGLGVSGPALAVSPAGLVVIPHPADTSGLSYFKLSAKPGSAVNAGTIELRNPTSRALRVLLAPVDGETLNTLGSSYAPTGSPPHGSTLWVHLGSRQITLAGGSRMLVPVSVVVPPGARAGEYLSGVSIEALDQQPRNVKKGGVAIASASRYALGTEVTLPGPLRSLIQFTGAQARREPAGLSFILTARSTGNTILQGVSGEARVSRAGHLVAVQPIGPGTFLAHTSIAFPVNAFRQSGTEGERYHVTAWMRYPGGIARLNTNVTFGHRAAVTQQQYEGAVAAPSRGTAWWKIAAALAAILYGLGTTALLLRRRTRASGATRP